MNNYLAEFLVQDFCIRNFSNRKSLAIGAALALIILITSNISGGHINPIMSVVMASVGR